EKNSQLWNQYFKKASNDILRGYSGKGYNYTAASYLVVSLGEDQVYSNQGDLLPLSAARNSGDLLPLSAARNSGDLLPLSAARNSGDLLP
ncbi:TPA: hypothetical protein IFZ29_004631, partial [Escherichia coli]|nr:hypothetical protein [Escherichia coli]